MLGPILYRKFPALLYAGFEHSDWLEELEHPISGLTSLICQDIFFPG